jgi:hypothetical protein
MNAKTTALYEQITGLLDDAAKDPQIQAEEYAELIADLGDFCDESLEAMAEDAGGGGEGGADGEAEEEVDDAEERDRE